MAHKRCEDRSFVGWRDGEASHGAGAFARICETPGSRQGLRSFAALEHIAPVLADELHDIIAAVVGDELHDVIAAAAVVGDELARSS